MENEKNSYTEWSKYLNDVFNCLPDEYGNRPCDYGFPCDACMVEQRKDK